MTTLKKIPRAITGRKKFYTLCIYAFFFGDVDIFKLLLYYILYN